MCFTRCAQFSCAVTFMLLTFPLNHTSAFIVRVSYFFTGGGVKIGEWSEHGRDGMLVLGHKVRDATEDSRHDTGELIPIILTRLEGVKE